MMTSINIQTTNNNIIEAIRAIIALDPETIITYENEPSLSEADQKKLEEIIAADDRGEVKYIALDEAIKEFENGDVIKCNDFADYQAKMRE